MPVLILYKLVFSMIVLSGFFLLDWGPEARCKPTTLWTLIVIDHTVD